MAVKHTQEANDVALSSSQTPQAGLLFPVQNNADVVTTDKTAIMVGSASITGSLEEYLAVETYFCCTTVQTGLLNNSAVGKLQSVIARHISPALRYDSAGRNFKSLETMMSATNTFAALTDKLDQLGIDIEVKNDLTEDLRHLSQALIELFETSRGPYGESSQSEADFLMCKDT